MTPAALIVSAVHLSRTFGEGGAAVHALTDVSVDFPAGGFTAIMGPSGSGTSPDVTIRNTGKERCRER